MNGGKKRGRAGSSSVEPVVPEFIQPCLARLGREPPEGENWVHEIKFDGYRLQARLDRGSVELRTRTGLDWTERFAGLREAFRELDVSSAILDGEAVVENEGGVSDFAALVAELKAGRSGRIVFFGFDLLYLDGVRLADQLLGVRKAALFKLFERVPRGGALRYSQHIEVSGPKMLAEACRLGLEGIVSKRADRPYRSGRPGDWLKTKCVQSDEFVVAGYLESTAIRNGVGALVAAYYQNGALVYAGRIGTGFTRQAATAIWQTLQAHRTSTPPVTTALDASQKRGVVWVHPVIVAQVTYRGFTGDHLLRHAAFKGLRDDKPASDVYFPLAPS